MTKFVQIYDLDQEHSDDMVVIQISVEESDAIFKVRTHEPINLQRWHSNFEGAMADVRDRASRNPYLTKLAVLLDEGTTWDERWGALE